MSEDVGLSNGLIEIEGEIIMRGILSSAASHVTIAVALFGAGVGANAAGPDQSECLETSGLAAEYCDREGNLLASLPDDPAMWRDPPTLVWAYTPIEDPAIYAELFKPFTTHLASCVGRQVVYYPVQSNASQVEALRSGRIHFAGFSTGPTVVAVQQAGAVPFAAKGTGEGIRGYRLVAVVRAESDFQELADLRDKRVAHSSAMSNSGNLAPRALFPGYGLRPDIDYMPILSGGHDRSLLGVMRGDYHMAAVASDVLKRMMDRGIVPEDSLRIIYESALFPTSSFVHAHDLAPDLARSLRDCFFSFSFPAQMIEEFNGDDRFLPLDYKTDWAVVRDVMQQVDGMFD